ncbi:MAG: hypothetical protein QM764_16750 [Chitinophagaceae bacterium]
MKLKLTILALIIFANQHAGFSQNTRNTIHFEFCDAPVTFDYNKVGSPKLEASLSNETITSFYHQLLQSGYEPAVNAIIEYKKEHELNDWLFYQLVRRTAEQLSPKAENYNRYTLYKWFLMAKSGYNTTLSIAGDSILFYVQSDDSIYNLPFHYKNNKQFVCLNYHDYGSNIDFEKEKFNEVPIAIDGANQTFSYKITRLPDFKASDYTEKSLQFFVDKTEYDFKIKLNPEIKSIFTNYPVTDYASYFNIPLSKETYSSLIPLLKKHTKGLNVKNGVDYLMRFTRYAFLFEPDTKNFGREKRMSPEETLLYDYSDCEDRAALFFYLVKELYDLPMIVLSYPKHITIAVKFDKPIGNTIEYNGNKYSVCEPTPQSIDLNVGQQLPELKHSAFEVVYAYNPKEK